MSGNRSTRPRPLVTLKERDNKRRAPTPLVPANDYQAAENDPLLDRIRNLEQQLELKQSDLDAQNQYISKAISDAEQRIKKHLSYRFGQDIIRCGINPIRWARLPLQLFRTYRKYLTDTQERNTGATTFPLSDNKDILIRLRQGKATSGSAASTKLRELVAKHPLTELVPAASRRPPSAANQRNVTSQSGTEVGACGEQQKQLKALSILDDFSYHCFASEFELVPADPTNWHSQIAQGDIDFLFVESAWRGNGGAWNYAISKFTGKFGAALSELIQACKKNDIPTVFWNKEDPLNYEVFINAARHFDHVFTTDENMIERYRGDLGHDRVYALPFAASSKLHTPILTGARNGRVAFAGSWHGRKYPLRAERLKMLFQHPQAEGVLDIFDRHSNLSSADQGLAYPSEYKDSILPAVPYKEITDLVYKKYSVVLNVNSVESSTSMLARRVYELCGCGTPVLSAPARSLEGKLQEIVPVAQNAEEAKVSLQKLLTDEIYALKLGTMGVRFVHSENTYTHRAAKIAKTVFGRPNLNNPSSFSVTAVCVSKRPWYASSVARMMANQKNVDLSVIYVAHGNEAKEEEIREAFSAFRKFKFIRIEAEGTVLAHGLNAALEACETDIVAKIDDDDYYGDYYLFDSCLALQYSGASLVGKASFFCYVEGTDEFGIRFPGKHYRYFKRVQGGTLVWNLRKTESLRFTPVRQGTDSLFIKDILEAGGRVFSSDPFNFVHVRHASTNNHTWAISDEDFLRATKVLGRGLRLDLAFT